MVGLILCAGLGTRLKEETRDKPKCMVDVGGKPVLEHIATHMNKHGIWRIVVNLHAFPEVVMKYFGQRFMYLYEPVPVGEFATVSIVRRWFPNEVLVTLNGDTITDLGLSEVVDRGWSGKCISDKTKRHMGTTIYFPGMEPEKTIPVDCEYWDMGRPEKLRLAREHFK